MVTPVRGWRREPLGAGLAAMQQRRQRLNAVPPKALVNLTEEEFVEGRRVAGASERLIASEVVDFRRIKEGHVARLEAIKQQRNTRLTRAVDDVALQPYVDAGRRRKRVAIAVL